MSTSSTTLTSLWQDDGSPMKTTSLIKAASTLSTEVKDDALRFFKDQGLETVAKEAGLIDGSGSLKEHRIVTQQPARKVQMVALPVSASPGKSYHFATPSQGTSLIVGSPQRFLTQSQLNAITQNAGGQYQHQLIPLQVTTAVAAAVGAGPGIGAGAESPQIIRKRTSIEIDLAESKRNKRGVEKGGKGLRHFSMKVCEKVQRKGITTYNEVADELVAEFSDPRNISPADQQYDQKNIRRRVYDALNVLMAMNIISKEKKEIRWIGLPTNSAQECENLQVEKGRRLERIRHKTQQLEELILQQIAFKNLVQRNQELEKLKGPPTSNSAIQLPFIIVNTNKKTVIDCSISNDKYEYLFNFDNTFEIHDDIEVLKRMGMAFSLEKGSCSANDLKKAIKMVPRALEPYVLQMGRAKSNNGPAATAIIGATLNRRTSTVTSSTSDTADMEVAMATSTARHAISRQSSVGSFSEAGPSRGPSEIPSDVCSDNDSDRSSPINVS